MRWFDSPPCHRMDVKESSDQRLLVTGPGTGARVVGGATAAFGTVFASMGLRFLRLPVPGPFKLVPLLFAAAGGGVAALGATTAFSSCSVEGTPGRLLVKWKMPGLSERSLEIVGKDVAAFEVTTHSHRVGSSEFGPDQREYEYRLVVVSRDGKAVELESFGTKAQAELRRTELARVVRSG